MKAEITRDLLRSVRTGRSSLEISDTRLPGFIARVMPSGAIHYSIRFTDSAGKQTRHSLKRSFPTTTVSDARELARIALGKIAAGDHPSSSRTKTHSSTVTLFSFIAGDYGAYLRTNNKGYAATIVRLKKSFAKFGDIPLENIDTLAIEKWRADRVDSGISPVTVNRDIGALRPVFSRALDWKLITEHPLKPIKALKSRADPIVRFLSDEEEARLRAALTRREARKREARSLANAWRSVRRYDPMPKLDDSQFVDYLMLAILLSLHTGIRQGELTQLHWADVDLDRGLLTVRAGKAKSEKTRHIPLNSEVKSVMARWRAQQGASTFVFPGRGGKQLTEVKTAWRNLLADAGIDNFRWHDMRHHFASRLVMTGTDLNMVRELLGHADLKMTLRYAHLSPQHKAIAVEKLVRQSPSTKED